MCSLASNRSVATCCIGAVHSSSGFCSCLCRSVFLAGLAACDGLGEFVLHIGSSIAGMLFCMSSLFLCELGVAGELFSLLLAVVRLVSLRLKALEAFQCPFLRVRVCVLCCIRVQLGHLPVLQLRILVLMIRHLQCSEFLPEPIRPRNNSA